MHFTHAYLIKRLLLDLFYPNRCGVCGCHIPFDEFFCNTCMGMFSSPPKNFHVPYVDFFTAFTAYDRFGKKLVARFKNESDGYALSGAAYLIYKSLNNDLGERLKDIDVITYIPMKKSELRKRGYNQGKIIARELSYLTDKPWRSLLVKIRANRPQKSLSAADRAENVKGVFGCKNPKSVKGRTVLLIDDVATTGSTISEAARVLKDAGAERLWVGVVAKTVVRRTAHMPL